MQTHTLRNLATVALAVLSCAPIVAQERVTRANYKLAAKYSSSFLRQFSYSTSISPQWIGKTDRFWYSFRTSAGNKYWLVDAAARTKTPLFDHAKVAAAVSEATEKAVEQTKLSLSSVKFSKDGKKLTFASGGFAFEYDVAAETVKKTGKARRSSRGSRSRSRGSRGGVTREELQRRMRERGNRRDEEEKEEKKEDNKDKLEDQKEKTEENTRGGERRGGTRTGRGNRGESTGRSRSARGSRGRTRGSSSRDGRSYSPDRSLVVFAKDHNLYVIEGTKLPAKKIVPVTQKQPKAGRAANAGKSGAKGKTAVDSNGKKTADTNGKAVVNASKGAAPKPAGTSRPQGPRFNYDDKKAVQLSKDGVDGFGFGGAIRTSTSRANTRGTTRGGTRGSTRGGQRGSSRTGSSRSPSRSSMARVSWSPDSVAFYATRRDSRHSKELFLVNSIAQPRPSLQTYRYSMPGEEGIRTVELHYFHNKSGKLVQLAKKWKDESYSGMTWLKDKTALRFTRRDRALRRTEFSELDPSSGKVTVLLAEVAADGYLKSQGKRTLAKRKEFVWWSERSGWGHYYLYGEDYKLKNAITSGAFRASRIVRMDEEAGVMYFRANGREQGNIYDEHLYRVRLDGTGLTLLDPGPGTHRSTLSPSKRFVVDNASAVDMVPTAVLRDAEGNEVMKLEETDLGRLKEVGWKMPTTFVVKAADGVTDLYGNMWKPFDFDSTKKYPIIVHVYPGPQMEGVSRTFSASGGRQQLAQLGFIVIQVGHRGGTPKRSRAYANFGYYNLRDFGLADKKSAIEQLAMRHSFIDVERVGIYGHSGGGFMTAAALLQKPYNEFFTAGIASSGNHDNNIYSSSWSERYHGLKEVAVEEKKDEKVETAGRTRGGSTGSGRGGRRTRRGTNNETSNRTEEKKTQKTTGQNTAKSVGTKTAKKAEKKTQKTTGQNTAKSAGTKTAKKAEKKTQKTTGQNIAKSAGTRTAKKAEKKTRFEIKVPTNAELAENLVGNLLLVHGEIDNNVHPANTMRLVDALIKANKRFDMLIIPGARHGYGRAGRYFTQRSWEFWAEHLLGERQTGADILKKNK